MSRHICFVTPMHLASNPRLVKAAAAASGAGYTVTVVFAQNLPGLVAADQTIVDAHPTWTVRRLDWTGRDAQGQWLRTTSGVRQRLAQRAFRAGLRRAAAQAESRLLSPMLRAARRVPADLFVAHNLAALPVAVRAARRRGVQAGFDAEDYHSGQLSARPADDPERQQARAVEQEWMPRCDYVTAASDGIANAYADELSIALPTVVHNVFPLGERNASLSQAERAAEREPGTETLYWFSQTIGPGRGLEDAVDALPHLDDRVHLALRGHWESGYQETLLARAASHGVAHRVQSLPTCLPGELVARTAQHSVGLALEPGRDDNNRVAVSNKLFTYWLAGLPAVVTDTPGQRAVSDATPGAAEVVSPGDPAALAAAAQVLLDSLPRRRAAARDAADSRWNWEAEQGRLLAVWDRVLSQASP